MHKLDDYRNKGQLVLKWITTFQRATVVMVKVGGHHRFPCLEALFHLMNLTAHEVQAPRLHLAQNWDKPKGMCTPTNADTKARKMKKEQDQRILSFSLPFEIGRCKWDLKSHQFFRY